jgi:hypothetical protein
MLDKATSLHDVLSNEDRVPDIQQEKGSHHDGIVPSALGDGVCIAYMHVEVFKLKFAYLLVVLSVQGIVFRLYFRV